LQDYNSVIPKIAALAKANKNKTIVLIGPQGVGKSTIGRLVAAKIGYNWLDTDNIILAKYKNKYASIKELYQDIGWAKFRAIERDVILELNLPKINTIISFGGGSHLYHNPKNYLAEGVLVVGLVFFELSFHTLIRSLLAVFLSKKVVLVR
jgi:shikimate kinase